MQPGSELESSDTFYSGLPSPYVYVCRENEKTVASQANFLIYQRWFQAVYSNPAWSAPNLTLADVTFAQQLNPFGINTWNGDLSTFNATGGKLLHYHGLQDFLISSENSARYYNHVRETMSLTHVELDNFYRYFRVSGMGHCRQGPGAWMIGQSTIGSTVPNPESNVLMAMVEWVEKGLAPETIRGVRYRYDNPKAGLLLARRHCRYPYQNRYAGPQPPSDDESWTCML